MKIISHDPSQLDNAAWEDIPAEKVIEGHPKARSVVLYADDNRFYSGIYECTAGKWRINYTESEFCTLIDGYLRLHDETGSITEYKAQESFLIPSGFKGIWEAVTPIRKHFALYEKT